MYVYIYIHNLYFTFTFDNNLRAIFKQNLKLGFVFFYISENTRFLDKRKVY